MEQSIDNHTSETVTSRSLTEQEGNPLLLYFGVAYGSAILFPLFIALVFGALRRRRRVKQFSLRSSMTINGLPLHLFIRQTIRRIPEPVAVQTPVVPGKQELQQPEDGIYSVITNICDSSIRAPPLPHRPDPESPPAAAASQSRGESSATDSAGYLKLKTSSCLSAEYPDISEAILDEADGLKQQNTKVKPSGKGRTNARCTLLPPPSVGPTLDGQYTETCLAYQEYLTTSSI